MKIGLKAASGAGAGALAAAFALGAQAQQTPPAAASGARMTLTSSGSALGQSSGGGEIIREIDDPSTGDRWLLQRNEQNPGGPGRLVLVAAHPSAHLGASAQAAEKSGEARRLPIIHAGDRLIVEEHTAVVDAVLEARALNPAAQGSTLEVRLTIGGNVVRAVALAPGRAALQPQTGERP